MRPSPTRLAPTAAHFQAIIDVAPDAVITTNESRRIVLFNRRAETIFGYAAAEVLGQPLSMLLPEAARRPHHEHVSDFAASGVAARQMSERRSVRGRRKDGALFSVDVSISHMRLDDHEYFTAIVRDVSAQIQLARKQRALLEREHAARSALLARAAELLDVSLGRRQILGAVCHLCVPALAPLCIIDTVDDDGVIGRLVARRDAAGREVAEDMNAYAADSARGFITRPALVDGRSVLACSPFDADVTALAADEYRSVNGAQLTPTSYMTAPFRAGNRVIGAIALVATAGSRRFDALDLALLDEIASQASLAMENARAYEVARRATALRDDVLAVVSHDLRNPLASMAMALASLEREPAPDRERRIELLRILRESVDWIRRMIQDLLDVASIEAGRLSVEPTSSDLVILLVRAAAMFEQAFANQNIDFILELPDHLPRVAVDHERLLQLVGNLLANAAKFTPAGGRVALEAHDRGREVVVSVRDTGRGIPPEDVPRLFDRYWSARRGARARSTGLRLGRVATSPMAIRPVSNAARLA